MLFAHLVLDQDKEFGVLRHCRILGDNGRIFCKITDSTMDIFYINFLSDETANIFHSPKNVKNSNRVSVCFQSHPDSPAHKSSQNRNRHQWSSTLPYQLISSSTPRLSSEPPVPMEAHPHSPSYSPASFQGHPHHYHSHSSSTSCPSGPSHSPP